MKATRILVANVGRHPELAELAAGLAERGLDVGYWTTLSWAEDDLTMRALQVMPNIKPVKLAANRKLPSPLSRNHVNRQARFPEILFIGSLPFSQKWSDRFLRYRTNRFDDAVANKVRLMRPEIVVAHYTSAQAIFQSVSHTTTKVLNYPIAHHGWVSARMSQERSENARWSDYLQLDGHDQAHLNRLDCEIELANYILVPSTFVAETFISRGIPKAKLRILPLGADASWFTDNLPIVEEHPQLEATEPFTVLFAGQLTQRKGISYLLEAYKMANLENSRLILAGRPHAGFEAELSAYSFAEWHGSLTRVELGRLYRKADVLVLPSLAEGFPLVAIEAMSLGTTVIVSENTFAHDVIQHGSNGFVVSATDTTQIANTLKLLRSDPALVKSAGLAAAATAAKFTWTSYRRNSSDLIISLMSHQAEAS